MMEIKESEIRNVVAWTFRLNDAEHNITAYLTDEEMWFVLRDIYEAVHETEMTEISILHRDECAIVALHNHDSLPKDTLVVNVSGIYSILNYIGTKTANDLGRWISKEVIPKGYHWIESEDNYVDSVANQRQEDSTTTQEDSTTTNPTQSDIHHPRYPQRQRQN